jgi:hypothetical protein
VFKQLFLAAVNCLRELVDISYYKAGVLHLLIVYEKLADTSNYKASVQYKFLLVYNIIFVFSLFIILIYKTAD